MLNMIKITKEQFLELRKNFSKDSSFAIWESENNVSDLSMFDDEDILEELNCNFIFVALNPANRDGKTTENNDQVMKDFENFHSSYKYQKDSKLCFALKKTKFWGSYITDFYKQIRETYSDRLKEKLIKEHDKVEKSKTILKEEVSIISKHNPNVVLIALGRETEKQLKKLFKNEYKIAYMTHYSYWGRGYTKYEDYRAKVLMQLKNQGLIESEDLVDEKI